jgi:hypothetical protein
MAKNSFKYYIRLSMKEEFSKHDIKGIITVLKSAIANIFKPLEDGTAVIYREKDTFHVYDFSLNRAVSEAEAEVILGLLEEWTDADFTMEVTTSEKYDLPEGETEIDLSAMKHNRWVSKQVENGWRYGLQFNENDKTDPKLRPYHELTEKLKNT